MMIARWHIDARFGHKPAVIESLKKWCDEIGTQIGWSSDRTRIATGAVGALESTVELEVQIEDLADLNASWAKLGSIEGGRAASSLAIRPSALPPLIGYRLGLSRPGTWIAKSQLFLLSSRAA